MIDSLQDALKEVREVRYAQKHKDVEDLFAAVGDFLLRDIEDVESALDEAIDRIKELEEQVEELENRVYELEQEKEV